MNKFYYLLMFTFLNVSNGSCQNIVEQNYVLSEELVKKKNPQAVSNARRGVYGIVNGKIVIYGGNEGVVEKFMLFDEKTQQLIPYLTLSNKSDKVLGILSKDSKVLKTGYIVVPEKYEDYAIEDIPVDSLPYQDLWILNGKITAEIDTYPFHFIDKSYDANFSEDGRYVIVNPYTDVSAGYRSEDDSRFYIYDLVSLNVNQINKQTIKCERCININMIGDKIYFVKEIEIGGGRDGYYKNIYIAPKDNINDTLKIAHDINLIKLSPDGKFILGQKYLHGEYVPVIIDVTLKRFQYILGRNYPIDDSFFSPYEKKFAFDFGTHIVYIKFPNIYPFDTSETKKEKRLSAAEKNSFWGKYQHEPLK